MRVAHRKLRRRISPAYRRVLWVALGVNAAMFLVEVGRVWRPGRWRFRPMRSIFSAMRRITRLSLVVLSMALAWRARAALVKGASMGVVRPLGAGRGGIQRSRRARCRARRRWAPLASLALAANVGCCIAAVPLSRRRREYALGLAVHAQRCDRQRRGDRCSLGRVRHGNGVARHRGRRDHGVAGAGGCVSGGSQRNGRTCDRVRPR